MKKIFIIAVTIIALLSFLSFKVSAEAESQYDNAYSILDSDDLREFLNESYVDYYGENNIDLKDRDWVNKITLTNIINEIASTVKEKSLKPLRVFFSLLSVILVTASLTGDDKKLSASKTAALSAVSVVSIIILKDIWSLISSLVGAIRVICHIVLVFVPVFETTLFLSGKITTAAASGGFLLVGAQALSLIAADYVMPVMGGYLGFAIASSMTPFAFIKQLGDTVKKASVVLLTAVFSVFTGIMGIQTTVNTAADNLTVKTTKFIIGTFVPIGAGALSEAANTVYSSMSLIKSSIGIYAVLSIVLICLPIIVLTLLFKLAFALSGVVAETFSQNEIADLIKSVNSLLSVVLSVILFFGGVFVFSIALILSLTGGG